MTTFNLINSLINPPAEPVVEAAVAPQEAPAPTETVTVEEAEYLGGGSRFGGIPYALHVTYSHPNLPEPLPVTVKATLDGEYSVDDRSFGYSYGSQRGTHTDVDDLVENLAWTGVTIPKIEANMDLLKMTPEQVAHISKVVMHYVATMEHAAIEQIVDMDTVIDRMRPDDDAGIDD